MGYRILNVKMNVNDELIMWNDVVAAFFKVLPKHLTTRTEWNVYSTFRNEYWRRDFL